MSPGRIDAATLRGRLGDGREIALIDVRDGGPFARCHLLTASSVPLAQIELRAPMLIPRRDVRVVAMDGDGGRGGEAERAAALLERHGWTDVSVLDGGLEGWRAAGHEVFSGTNVPSKAFGEHVEHAFDTPRIEPGELERWRAEGRDVVVFDSRPLEEYRQVSIPGAADCPGAELVLRVPAQLRSPDTIVVVNCAGRTRSILGAQSLRRPAEPGLRAEERYDGLAPRGAADRPRPREPGRRALRRRARAGAGVGGRGRAPVGRALRRRRDARADACRAPPHDLCVRRAPA
jgi:rhodanese-related sulfurtransferase